LLNDKRDGALVNRFGDTRSLDGLFQACRNALEGSVDRGQGFCARREVPSGMWLEFGVVRSPMA
jgi:hypothetical protein